MLRFAAMCAAGAAADAPQAHLVANVNNTIHLVSSNAQLPDGKERFQYSPGKYLTGYSLDRDPKEPKERFGWQAESHKPGYLSPGGDYVKTGPGKVVTTPHAQALRAGCTARSTMVAVVLTTSAYALSAHIV